MCLTRLLTESIMQVQQTIESKLQSELTPSHLEVVNESHMHSVPPNSETHFKLVLVSDAFDGMLPVRRHQLLYKVLADELAGPVHALSVKALTPGEARERA